jgi:GT2 family glycosyltransferase
VTAARATVVVVNWNGAALLPACLEALAAQQTSAPFETWVVDNASTDGSVELMARDFPHVRVLQNPDNRGFAGGNNTALRQVTTPYAVLLNNDASPEPDWLEQLLAPFEEPGNERLGAVTAKVVFAPRFVRLHLETEAFRPGGADPRELGVRVHRVRVGGTDVTERVLWESSTYGAEGVGEGRFRWTRPAGDLLVPLPDDSTAGSREVTVSWAAERDKPATLSWAGGEVTATVTETGGDTVLALGPDVPAVDVVNNVGSVVLTAGYGADLGYQQVDEGQYDEPADVFAMCGCAVAFRTEAGREVDWFDDDFFLYYEDTDLSWRLRAAGWTIRYEPKALVRHIHSATTVEWSPVFVFHTTRNRLLMLVKNATAARARHEVVSFLADSLTMVLTAVKAVLRGRRPARRPLQMRLRVLWSLLLLTPRMLRKRRAIHRSAQVGRVELERWLVERR